MAQIISGNMDRTDFTIGIAVAKWNSFITDELLKGAIKTFENRGFEEHQLIVAECPGAYEIPFTVKQLLPKVDGVVTLGAVIRGETPHFDYVCDAVNYGVTELNLQYNKPIVFGVLTTDNVQQARERCGLAGDRANKGIEASLALLQMLTLQADINQL
jgi:6,7-dimethyl-8-ribityllumazine synthase